MIKKGNYILWQALWGAVSLRQGSQRDNSLKKRKINWSIIMGVPGSIGALIALWILLGFPTLATSSDIQRLDRKQADTAVEVYATKQRSLLVIAPSPGTPAHDAWQQELKKAGDDLKRAEDRKIELSK